LDYRWISCGGEAQLLASEIASSSLQPDAPFAHHCLEFRQAGVRFGPALLNPAPCCSGGFHCRRLGWHIAHAGGRPGSSHRLELRFGSEPEFEVLTKGAPCVLPKLIGETAHACLVVFHSFFNVLVHNKCDLINAAAYSVRGSNPALDRQAVRKRAVTLFISSFKASINCFKLSNQN
jgi:hypothetical protein